MEHTIKRCIIILVKVYIFIYLFAVPWPQRTETGFSFNMFTVKQPKELLLINIIKLLSEICLGILKSISKCDDRYVNMFPMFYIRGVT